MPAGVRTNVNSRDVFINCPFDATYRPLFEAIVFVVSDLGFVPRCALETDDAGESRLVKIERIIEECRYGINDLSAVELDSATGLPRFNMPLELGLFMGCRRYGPKAQAKKRILVLDRLPYRYRAFISDISGQDIRTHGGVPEQVIREVRDWLRLSSGRTTLPGGTVVVERYGRFRERKPRICTARQLREEELTFLDLVQVIDEWSSVSS